MAEGRHVSDAEIEEMERRKRMSAQTGEDPASLPGEHEQESDRTTAFERTRLIDTVIASNPD